MAVVGEMLSTEERGVTDSDVLQELPLAGWVHLWRGRVNEAQMLLNRLAFLRERSGPETRLTYDAVSAGFLRAQGRGATPCSRWAMWMREPPSSWTTSDPAAGSSTKAWKWRSRWATSNESVTNSMSPLHA